MPIKVLHVCSGPACKIYAIAYPIPNIKRDPCATLAFLSQQGADNPKEWAKLAALLRRIADYGPPSDESKFRRLGGSDELFEFKTAGGLRLICFKDGREIIICTHGVAKLEKKRFKGTITSAENDRINYLAEKTRGTLQYGPKPRKTLK